MDQSTYRLLVTGLVQGVGFRPFIFRLASEYGFQGRVENRNNGVMIEVNGIPESIHRFCSDIAAFAPEASSIEDIELVEIERKDYDSFTIFESGDVSDEVTEISPDIAVCPDCLLDMRSQARRIAYPLINCTHCGPRFSIIRDLPYDRKNTSMEAFSMCPDCRLEYEDIMDRRFHAQPVACNHCGPVYSLQTDEGITNNISGILEKVRELISSGGLLAIKGTGGFHLVCDAYDTRGIKKLRKLKLRDGKPFALMVKNMEEVRKLAEVNGEEESLLSSWQRPIVLLRKREEITEGVADGLSTLGIMLPYMPFHHMLFDHLDTSALVMTSGNFSGEPILISNEQAGIQFGKQMDGMVSYNREIHNRVDDSVTAVIGTSPLILRRARAYTPSPVRTGMDVEGILGTGAELTGSFCMGKGSNAIMSQYTGDLKNLESYNFYKEIYLRFCRLFRFRPELVVSDLHPDYLATRFAGELAEETGIPHVRVQHHHAHIASGMLCGGLEGEVIGFSFDGTGLGSDGNSWGAEVMKADYHDFERLYHFEYIPLPGGDRAITEPWRMAVAYLHKIYGDSVSELDIPLTDAFGKSEIDNMIALIVKKINSPLASSAGRLFDAVAALTGLNYRSTYQAEGPMLLESAIDFSVKGSYSFDISGDELSFQTLIRQIVDDIHGGVSTGAIAAKFHHSLAGLIVYLAMETRNHYGLDRVVLGGGTFQNRYLTKKVIDKLEKERFEVYLPDRIPVNDQGIAAGQLAIGAHRRG